VGNSNGGGGAGGAIYVADGKFYGEFDTFSNDTVSGGTGGNSVNAGNGGEVFGGAVYLNATDPEFDLSTFSSDVAYGGTGGPGLAGGAGANAYGGALYSATSGITLLKDTFSSDAARGGLGGRALPAALVREVQLWRRLLQPRLGCVDAHRRHAGREPRGQRGGADAIGGAIYNAGDITALNLTIADNQVTVEPVTERELKTLARSASPTPSSTSLSPVTAPLATTATTWSPTTRAALVEATSSTKPTSTWRHWP